MNTRRDILKQGGALFAITFLSKYASAQQQTLREQIKENLSKLEKITEKEAGPDYNDPNNTGNPLYCVKKPESMLAQNFKLKEFATSDGKVQPYARIDEDLIILLQTLRNDLQQPVIVSSAYRSLSRNKTVGGAPKSTHCSGQAADICIKGLSPSDLTKRIESLFGEHLGLHVYNDGHVHVDVRGYKARW